MPALSRNCRSEAPLEQWPLGRARPPCATHGPNGPSRLGDVGTGPRARARVRPRVPSPMARSTWARGRPGKEHLTCTGSFAEPASPSSRSPSSRWSAGPACRARQTDGARRPAAPTYLVSQQQPDGSIPAFSPIGSTSDAVLAFVAAGAAATPMKKALGFLKAQTQAGNVERDRPARRRSCWPSSQPARTPRRSADTTSQEINATQSGHHRPVRQRLDRVR